MGRRIVVTGIGGLCGLGNDAASIWEAMREGRSAIGPITTIALHDLKVAAGCEIKQLPDHGIDRKRTVTMDRFSLLAVIAAQEAMTQAGLTVNDSNTYRSGAVVGVGVYGAETVDENYRQLLVH